MGHHGCHVLAGFAEGYGLDPQIPRQGLVSGQPTLDPVGTGIVSRGGYRELIAEPFQQAPQIRRPVVQVAAWLKQRTGRRRHIIELAGHQLACGGHELQDIVDVAPDRMLAKGRFRCFLMGGIHETKKETTPIPSQFWEGGIYENTYVKENGTWKFKVFHYNLIWQAEYEKGWAPVV